MGKLSPVSWDNFVRRLKELGFDGPFFGGKHPKMKKNSITLIIPNKHDGDIGIGFLTRLLRQAGISKEEWLGEDTQSGLSLIATIIALLMFSLFIAVAVSLVTTGAHIGVQETQGQQAFDIADGGLHYTLALNKLNIPNYSTYGTWINLGAGQFKVDTAYLTNPFNINDATMTVNSTADFPPAGRLTIGSDFSITYGGITPPTTFTGIPIPHQLHNTNDSVYPATQLNDTISAANCNDLVAIDVDENPDGFDITRPFFIDEEYFLCQSKKTTTPFRFENCKRCYLGSSRAAHNTNSYASQYILTSTGRVTNIISSNVQRVVRISAGPWEEH